MALKTSDLICLSWDDVEKSVNDLCNKIRFDQLNIDSVTGIARGGLIPAVLISHKLGLPYTDVILPNTLVVDDICDSGVTLEKAPGVWTAVLHYKPHTSCFQPNMWADIHEGDEWLIYPWETNNSYVYIFNLVKKMFGLGHLYCIINLIHHVLNLVYGRIYMKEMNG